MKTAGFTVWDAPRFGFPRAGWLGSHWSGRQLISVTVRRCRTDDADNAGNGDEDLPDVAVTSMDLSMAGATQEGLVLGPLLELTSRLMSARRMSAREAGEAMVRLAGSPGVPASLTLSGRLVEALRFEVPGTGDWAVAVVDDRFRVCVAGNHEIAVPALDVASTVLWEPTLRRQIADMTRGGVSQRGLLPRRLLN